ncbi:protein DpdD [Streptacidiphilus sp. MAP5-3]|uniref:protein DpdD n=1 Tax=Streptacidiphilus sp. MAP5-3 TaxID=3156265 RepID=UPI003511FAB6
MTRQQHQRMRTREEIESFLARFFGPGNDAWPNLEPGHPGERDAAPFVEVLRRGADTPVVLPRRDIARDWFAAYVIARDPADATKAADLINAFAGPTYVIDEVVRPIRLDPNDPVEQAILDFAGSGSTFRLRTGVHRMHRTKLIESLQLMQRTAAGRPPRLWRVAKPVGRLLAEFEAALAAGGQASSGDVLEQLAAAGGVTATNLACLRIKRLYRLGLSAELLAMPGLADVVRQDPPGPVKEAILGAIYAMALQEPLSAGDVEAAKEALIAAGRYVPDLLDGDMRTYEAGALTVALLAASVRSDVATLTRLVRDLREAGQWEMLPALVWDDAVRLLEGSAAPQHDGEAEGEPGAAVTGEPSAPSAELVDLPETAPPVDSWHSLIAAVAEDRPEGKAVLRAASWTSWSPPASDDQAIADVLDNLGVVPAERAWGAVGPFIDAVGYQLPAGCAARAFIRNALTFDRFAPGDLLALHALSEIALRAAPSAEDYGDLLDEIGSECDRWVAAERASIALDFVDRLVLAACPDVEARGNLAYALLEPLWRHQARLQEADLAFARRLSNELGIEFTWAQPDSDGVEHTPLADLPALNVLLYSLDHAVLARCADELNRLAPAVKVTTAHDHVGGPQLRQKARGADVIVIATRCAKHAATGFISQHSGSAQIAYADGSGSASMLRASVSGLRAAVADH